MAEEKTILLTQEAYDKMKEELAWREGEYRDEILSKVSAARAEGDLSENGGYQAAREAQRESGTYRRTDRQTAQCEDSDCAQGR